MYDAWKNPETLAIVSKIAGIDLVTAMDWEIGHVNISVQTEEEKNNALVEAVNGVEGTYDDDIAPIVDWHTDSYPFVCVTMLSDCTKMIGGETALRTGNGSVVKVRGPQMVCQNIQYIDRRATDNPMLCFRDVPWCFKAGTSSIEL